MAENFLIKSSLILKLKMNFAILSNILSQKVIRMGFYQKERRFIEFIENLTETKYRKLIELIENGKK